jgi:hypothetical protein
VRDLTCKLHGEKWRDGREGGSAREGKTQEEMAKARGLAGKEEVAVQETELRSSRGSLVDDEDMFIMSERGRGMPTVNSWRDE